MEVNLLDRMLDTYCREQTPVAVTLQNKTRIAGVVKAFDSYVILLKAQKQEIVYRHAVSFLTPTERDDRKQAPAPRPAAAAAAPSKAASYPAPTADRPKAKQPARVAAAPGEPGIGNTMKEGLLKWMNEQKASGKK